MSAYVPAEPGQEAANCVADLERADFVAVRLDSSDDESFQPQCQVELDDFYAKAAQALRDTASSLLPHRLGLCCGVWCRDRCLWELRSHELGLWPGAHLEMPAKALQALRRAAGKASQPDASPWAGLLAFSSRWVIEALRLARVPIIVHNGLADLLQLFDKFAGRVPSGHLEFGRAWIEKFPVVLDTCLLADDEEAFVLAPCPRQLHKNLLDTPRSRGHNPPAPARFKEHGLYTHRASSGLNGLIANSGEGSTARAAMEIAEIFLLLMARRLQSSASLNEADASRHRLSDGQNDGRMSPSPEGQPRPAHGRARIQTCMSTMQQSPSSKRSSKALLISAMQQSPSSKRSRTTLPPTRTPSDGSGSSCVSANVESSAVCAAGCITLSSAPTREKTLADSRKKRPWSSSSDKAAECSAAVSSLAQKLAGFRDMFDDSRGCPLPDIVARASETCRLFHNRVAAVGTPPGYLRLDTLLQVQLIKRLRKVQGKKPQPPVADSVMKSASLCSRVPRQPVGPIAP